MKEILVTNVVFKFYLELEKLLKGHGHENFADFWSKLC